MARIPDTYISDLLSRVDIVDVIDRRVKLKKHGQSFMACCPFHDEKTPSFAVSQPKQLYNCFGCGAGGDAIRFIQEFDCCDFRTAVGVLARHAGVAPPDEFDVDDTAWKAQAEERARQRAAYLAEQELREKALKDAIADVSQAIVENHCKTTGISPYLGRKKIKACGALFARNAFLIVIDAAAGLCELVTDRAQFKRYFEKTDVLHVRRVGRGDLIVPVRNAVGAVRSLQIITKGTKAKQYADAKKRHLKCGEKQGNFHVIPGDDSGPVVVVEGFATGASVAMATGFAVAVCFDSGNMVHLAPMLRDVFPGRDFLVAGDFDHSKDSNPGADKAREAAAILGCPAAFPSFPDFDGDTDRTDFNDLHVEFGLPAVDKQLRAAMAIGAVPELPVSPSENLDPPDYITDVPPPESSIDLSPAPPEIERPTLDQALGRYALVVDDGRIWDNNGRKFLKQKPVRDFLGAETFKEWMNHKNRRNVNAADVVPLLKAAAIKRVDGLADALERYVYLNPSQNVWDTQMRKLVGVADLRCAIANCYNDWIKHPNRKEIPAENLVFDPEQKTPTENYINRFTGLAMEPVRDDARCANIVKMLQRLCNNDFKAFNFLAQWLAYPLINVGAKMATAILMHSSVHGSGKSWFFDGVMRAIYGSYCGVFGQAELESQYNDWLSEGLFGVFEEVLSRGQKYSHTGTLKQMITGANFRVSKKFVAGWEEANHMNMVFLSNEVQPLPVEASDRRFLVVWPEEKLIDELKQGVLEDIENGGVQAFYAWLLDYPMSPDFNRHTEPPMTEAKERLIDFGRPSWEVFYLEWSRKELDYPYCSVTVRHLFRAYERWCAQRREHCMGQNKFAGFIGSILRKRKDLHYNFNLTKGKAAFFIVPSAEHDKNQQEWLGKCVEEWEDALKISEPELGEAC